MNTTETSPPLRLFLALLAGTAFVLNWLWEMAQMPAFVEMAGRSWAETALPCAWAALGDVVAILGIYGLVALAAGTWRWGVEGRWNVYAAAALLGAAAGIAFEWWSLAFGRWTYNQWMPVVLGLGVGLWPLLQLALLAPLSLSLAWWWVGQFRTAPGGR